MSCNKEKQQQIHTMICKISSLQTPHMVLIKGCRRSHFQTVILGVSWTWVHTVFSLTCLKMHHLLISKYFIPQNVSTTPEDQASWWLPCFYFAKENETSLKIQIHVYTKVLGLSCFVSTYFLGSMIKSQLRLRLRFPLLPSPLLKKPAPFLQANIPHWSSEHHLPPELEMWEEATPVYYEAKNQSLRSNFQKKKFLSHWEHVKTPAEISFLAPHQAPGTPSWFLMSTGSIGLLLRLKDPFE